MRIAFFISILLLTTIAIRGQGYHFYPEYYPIEIQDQPEWVPVGFSVDPGHDFVGRGTWWERNRRSLAITGIQLGAIILDASGDAIYDMGKESHNSGQMAWGHTLQAAAIAGMGTTLVMITWDGDPWDGVRFAIGYTAMRYALFDLTYNLTRGIDPLYADGWKATMPPDGRVFTQVVMLGVSVSINFVEF